MRFLSVLLLCTSLSCGSFPVDERTRDAAEVSADSGPMVSAADSGEERDSGTTAEAGSGDGGLFCPGLLTHDLRFVQYCGGGDPDANLSDGCPPGTIQATVSDRQCECLLCPDEQTDS